MNNDKAKKVRKLRKKKIWPSVVFLVIFMMAFITFIVFLLDFFISYVINSRLETAYENSEYIVQLLDQAYTEEGWEDIFSAYRLKNASMVKNNQICIADKNNRIVAKNGDEEPSLDKSEMFYMNKDYKLYLDEASMDNIMECEQGNLKLSYDKILKHTIRQDFTSEEYNTWKKGSLIDISYWMEIPIDGTEESLLVKNNLAMKNKDILSVGIICVITIMLMTFPMLFFLVNLISSVLDQRRMIKILYLDTVTGGDNWYCFKEKGTRILKKQRNQRKTFWMLSMCMNKYHNYCICYGSKAGEELLENLNSCLKPMVHKDELYAHYANSHFAVLLKEDSKEKAEKRIVNILGKLQQVQAKAHLSFQVGVCEVAPVNATENGVVRTRHNLDIDGIYNHASSARKTINGTEGNEIVYFDKQMLEEQLWQHHVEERMELALQNKEFKVYLQPKYAPSDKTLGGAEALVRWINSEDGFIPPNRFIPIFEENGFILKLDDYMISEVAKLQASWILEGKKVVPISVNVSRAHFSKIDLAEHICELVDHYGAPHHSIELELTESAFFDDKGTLLTTVKKLQQYGFVVSMDDFGSGYSSLNSLKDLPLDVIKLDAEFFRGSNDGNRGEIVIKQAIALAQGLNMHIVAEGIESKEQVDFLAGQGCDLIQGFYFAKPMPVDEFAQTAFKKQT